MNSRNPINAFDRLLSEMGSDLSRAWVGFDSIADGLRNTLGAYESYPPYNVEKLSDTQYRITLALAGFSKDDLTITKEGDFLIIAGKIEKEEGDTYPSFLYQGIANRAFTRKVQLAHDIEVVGADMESGLLHVELEKVVPKERQPRVIEIGGKKTTKKSKS